MKATNEDTRVGGPPASHLLETAERLRALAVAYPPAATIPVDDLLSEASRLEVAGNDSGAATLRGIVDAALLASTSEVMVNVLVRVADDATRAVDKRVGELTDAAGILRETAARLAEVADDRGGVHADHLIVERLAHAHPGGNAVVVSVLSLLIAPASVESPMVPLHSLTFHAERLESLADLRTPEQDEATRAREAAHTREVGRSNAVARWRLTPGMLKVLKGAKGPRINGVAQPIARALADRGLGDVVGTRGTNGSRAFPRATFVLNPEGVRLAATLRPDCGHGYGPMDSCPGCDADEEARAQLHAPTLRYVIGELEKVLESQRAARVRGHDFAAPMVRMVTELRATADRLESGADGA